MEKEICNTKQDDADFEYVHEVSELSSIYWFCMWSFTVNQLYHLYIQSWE